MRSTFILLLTLTTLACAHSAKESGATGDFNGAPGMPPADYTELVKANTSRTNQYEGIYQTFQADITILNNEVLTAELKQRAAYLQWDAKQFNDEREKMLQDNSAYAHFFLRFFTPEHEYDDLHKPKSIWKVFLDVSGQRFEAKVKKAGEKFVEIHTLFPNMDRFSTPYELTFNVPMSTVQSGPCKVTLTSSLGTAEFQFPVKK